MTKVISPNWSESFQLNCSTAFLSQMETTSMTMLSCLKKKFHTSNQWFLRGIYLNEKLMRRFWPRLFGKYLWILAKLNVNHHSKRPVKTRFTQKNDFLISRKNLKTLSWISDTTLSEVSNPLLRGNVKECPHKLRCYYEPKNGVWVTIVSEIATKVRTSTPKKMK